ncbi:MAG: hypothetical protein WKF71_03130 [Pyrinomonadaceae bacterium]
MNDDETSEPQITPEEYLAERKKTMRKRSSWAIGLGLTIIFVHFALFAVADVEFTLLFRSIFLFSVCLPWSAAFGDFTKRGD